MPAGAGKTRVAVEVILSLRQAHADAGKVSLFLTPSIPLAHQQCEVGGMGAGLRAHAFLHASTAGPCMPALGLPSTP